MPRQSHKKSRHGCLGCKKRHVKCDETKPECVNCLTANKRCSYLHFNSKGKDGDHQLIATSIHPSPSGSNLAATTSTTPTIVASDPNINLDHLELIHHFSCVTSLTLSSDPEMQDVWRNVVPRYGLRYPFLMYELLALAALHLGYLRPAQQHAYYQNATEMQNQAMAGFHAIEMKIDESNCVAVMLFSSFLALQVLADPTPTLGLSSTGYIDHFCRCLKLMHGTRVLIVDDWWESVRRHEELSTLWNIVQPTNADNERLPTEVNQLTSLTRSPSLSPGAVAAYDEAISMLRWQYALAKIPQTSYSTVRWALAWPVVLKREYLELLDERRPEALVVLAYFGTLLHFYRESWVVRDAGARLVRSINEHVGGRWEEWMRWPMSIVRPPSAE